MLVHGFFPSDLKLITDQMKTFKCLSVQNAPRQNMERTTENLSKISQKKFPE